MWSSQLILESPTSSLSSRMRQHSRPFSLCVCCVSPCSTATMRTFLRTSLLQRPSSATLLSRVKQIAFWCIRHRVCNSTASNNLNPPTGALLHGDQPERSCGDCLPDCHEGYDAGRGARSSTRRAGHRAAQRWVHVSVTRVLRTRRRALATVTFLFLTVLQHHLVGRKYWKFENFLLTNALSYGPEPQPLPISGTTPVLHKQYLTDSICVGGGIS